MKLLKIKRRKQFLLFVHKVTILSTKLRFYIDFNDELDHLNEFDIKTEMYPSCSPRIWPDSIM